MRTALKSLLTAAIVLSPLPLAAQDPTEVTLWHMEQPPHRVARIQELIDAFNAANPDVLVKQEPQNWGEIYAKAPAAVAAGAGPDMLFAIPDFAPIFKDLGQLDSVADFVAELDAKHDFVDSAVEAYTYDDGIWAVPMYNMTMHMWYRPSVLEAAGVKRVSLGGVLYRQALGSLVTAARRLKAGDFDIMAGAPTAAEITALLPPRG